MFSWPTIGQVVKSPVGETFTELYILGPDRNFDNIPFNIKTGETYSVYLGVGNHMGSSCYYTCYFKIRSGSEPLPNQLIDESPLPALCEFSTFLQDEQTWDFPITFKIKDLIFADDSSYLSTITINGQDYPVNEYSLWNSNKTGYYYGLFVELWMFNVTSGHSQFHNRSVHLSLNMTQ